MIIAKNKLKGCFWGGAIGDAWGAPLERLTRTQIIERFGEPGSLALCDDAVITDDTQKLLFTMEALIFGIKNSKLDAPSMHLLLRQAYLRWLQTQDENFETSNKSVGFLLKQSILWKTARGGRTTYASLRHMRDTGDLTPPPSTAKGCGGVMAIAPVGFVYSPLEAFEIGCVGAKLTHSEPDAYVPAGAMAMLVSLLQNGNTLNKAANEVRLFLSSDARFFDINTVKLFDLAIEASQEYVNTSISEKIDFIENYLGQGWNGDEALAIALFAALTSSSFHDCIVTAVNHTGDSDSTGAIAGNIWGAAYGDENIDSTLKKKIAANKLIDKSWFIFYQYLCQLSTSQETG